MLTEKIMLSILPAANYTMVLWALSSGFVFGAIRPRGLLGMIFGAFFAIATTAGYVAYKFFVRG